MQTLASCAVIPSKESLFGLFRATKSSQAKEYFPLLANFIDELTELARAYSLSSIAGPALLTLLSACPKARTIPKSQASK
jgi:hypothetical protein